MGKIKKQPEVDKLMGKDDDLKTPKHDEIMIWLNKAIDIFLPKWTNIKKEWSKSDFLTWRKENDSISFYGDLPPKPNIKIIRKLWEPPITRGQSEILVAIPDMVVNYQVPMLLSDKEIHFEDFYAWFEVKSKIVSLGEVVRQINIYKRYTNDSSHRRRDSWFLIGPKPCDDFIDILNEQEIHFIEYDPELIIQDEFFNNGKINKVPIKEIEVYVGADKENS